MTLRKRSSHLSRLRCEHLEPRLVLSGGALGAFAVEPLLHSPGTARFDGIDDLIQVADQPELNTNEFTIALWFNAADAAAGTQSLVARGEDWAHDRAQWVVELNDAANPGKVQLWYEEANDADHYFATESTIESDQWYHLAVTRSGDGRVEIYLDGRQELDRVDAGQPASVNTPVLLGARRNQPGLVQDYFDGSLHEVTVFGEVLSSEAIDALMEQTRPQDCSISDRIDISEIGSDVDVAMYDDGSFVATWMQIVDESEEIFARRFDAHGNSMGERIAVNLTTVGRQQDAAVATRPDGGFVVVWASEIAGSEAIYARLFNAHGVPISGELPVGIHPDAYGGHPNVSVDGQGNFVVVFNGHWNGEGVLARRFGGDGVPLSEVFEVDAGARSSYGWPQVAMNDDGWFIATSPQGEWGTTTLVTFAPDGKKVSDSELDSYYGASLAVNDDGLFVVSWVGSYAEQPIGDPFALFAQVYSLLGHQVGPQVLVTPGKAGGRDWNIYDSDVTMDDESFMVTWRDYDFDETSYSGNGIYASRFDLEGNPLGSEMEIGVFGDDERLPAVAGGADGDYVIAWQQQWGNGVFAKTVHCPTTETTELPDPLLSIEQLHEFDGVDDYLSIEQANLNINQYTIGFWFKADDPGDGEQTLIARGEDANDKAQWIVRLNSDENPGKLDLWYENSNDRDAVFAGTTTIPGGQWTYATVTRSADGQVQIFLNGALELSSISSIVPVSTETPVLIGARHNAPNKIQDFFDGSIDNVTVFDEVLSAYQINHLMASTTHEQQSAEPVYSHPGPIELNGVDQYLSIDDPALNTSVYTIAMSFRADNPRHGTQALVARGEDWTKDKAQWVVELNDPQSRDRLQLWYEETNDADHYFAAPTTIEADTWYHAVFTRAADGMVRIYVDGQQVYEKLDAASPAMVDTPVLIGARLNQPGRIQDYFDGTIEDVQIYNYAMTPGQVLDVIPPPRLMIESPIDGTTFTSSDIDLNLSFDRPLTDVSYSLNGSPEQTLMVENWVSQEDPDVVDIWSGSVARATFDYNKPDWAVAAQFVVTYQDTAGVHTVAYDVPDWDALPEAIFNRVYYRSDATVTVESWTAAGWQILENLGHNNPGGSGNDATTLYDGNYATGAAYHHGAKQWLTSGLAGTYVKFLEESVRWDIRVVEDAISRTISAEPGLNTLTVYGTDTLGKSTSTTVTFTVEEEAVVVVNGDFETGELGPWVLTDSGAVVTADLFTPEIPAAGGNYMGYITTGRNELPSDLHFADLDGNGVPEREYSALAIEVFTPAAALVEVDLNFLTADILPGGGFGDSDLFGVTTGLITNTDAYRLLFAAAPMDDSYAGTATPLTADDFSNEEIWDDPYGTYPTIADTSVFYGQTGFHRYSFSLEPGIHTLTFFVADSHTDGEATAMLIDNLTLSLIV